MSRILIVDDEPQMRMGLQDNLEFEGFQIDTAADGVAGLACIEENPYDLIILDVMMPGMSGFDVCRKMREQGNQTPVLMLTAKGEEIDKVLGLELGADDYMTKPFGLRELLARIKAILRRSGDSNSSPAADEEGPGEITIGRLRVLPETYQAYVDGTETSMTHKEFEIIRHLWQHRGATVSREQLLNEVWGFDDYPTTRTVDNFMLKLRKRIEKDPAHPRHILTVHGMGYKLVE
ncbi:MAG: response regulator transcription factor [Calditrichaeota bacterium]|nr:response regulator transcription factor [Calditrichota bacterium]